MIPTRKRPGKLVDTIKQLYKTASGDDFQIIIRVDDDDLTFNNIRRFLEKFKGIKINVGPRLGYHMLDAGYYAGMEQEATTHWVWIAGDDMLLEGDWLGELRKVPLEGYIVQPEISKLNASTYHFAEGQAFPIFPRECWRKYQDSFPVPFDTAGSDLLLANGWRTWFLPGITMWHDRAGEAEIAEHRKM